MLSEKTKKLLELPCQTCGAQCCRYVAVEIDTPSTKREYDIIRWYLLHENIYIFIDHEGAWHLEIETTCRALRKDHRCGEYETRPHICRDHGWPIGSCEYFEKPYEIRFESVEAFERYLDKKGIDWRWKRRPKTARA